jgi:hypothetical protein
MLAPHHAEDAELGESWVTLSEKLPDLFVLVVGEAMLPESLRREG